MTYFSGARWQAALQRNLRTEGFAIELRSPSASAPEAALNPLGAFGSSPSGSKPVANPLKNGELALTCGTQRHIAANSGIRDGPNRRKRLWTAPRLGGFTGNGMGDVAASGKETRGHEGRDAMSGNTREYGPDLVTVGAPSNAKSEFESAAFLR